MRIEWTAAALRDLASIRDYIADENPMAANQLHRKLVSAVAGLMRFPGLGRPGRRAGTREFVVTGSPYIVAYRLRAEAIEIIRVLHGRQRWPDRL